MFWWRRKQDADTGPARPSLAMPSDVLLGERLRLLGLSGVKGVRTHTNRTVMLSLGRHGVLRIHRGYAAAPDRVLRAIVRFLQPGQSRAKRKSAEREFLAFPVEQHAEAAERRVRQERPEPGDLRILNRLAALHETLNHRYFDGRLATIPLRLSGRMRTRLGEVTVDLRSGQPLEIAISRAHLRLHAWGEVEQTVLHEMVHQWQAENGLPVDHGRTFRRKADEVGVEPRARRRRRLSPRRLPGEREYEAG